MRDSPMNGMFKGLQGQPYAGSSLGPLGPGGIPTYSPYGNY